MVSEIYGVTEEGERQKLDYQELVLVTKDNIELTLEMPKPDNKHDFDLLLNACISVACHVDGQRCESRIIKLTPGASNLVFVKVEKTL